MIGLLFAIVGSLVVQGFRPNANPTLIQGIRPETALPPIQSFRTDTAPPQEIFKGHVGPVWSIALSPDGKTAISASEDNTIRAWNVEAVKQMQKIEASEGKGIRSVTYSPDDSRIYSVSLNGPVVCWDANSLKELYRLGGDTTGLSVLDCSSDGGKIILGGMDLKGGRGHLSVWDAKSGSLIFDLPGHTKKVDCVRFDLTGRFAISGGRDSSVRIWDIPNRKERHCLRAHLGGVLAVAFSPDGTLCASGGEDGSVRIWNAETGEQVACLGAEIGCFNSLDFTPDGKRLVAGGGVPNSHDIRLQSDARRVCRLFIWNVETKMLLGNLQGHQSSIGSLAVAKDGLHVLSGSWDKTLRRYRIPDVTERIVAGQIRSADSVAAWSSVDVSDAEIKDEFVRISGFQQLPTRLSHSGPVEITVVARTDENNIRLWGFRGGLVIFNWDVQKGHLRIHAPSDVAKGFLGPVVYSQPHPVEPNRWHTLGWKVTEAGMSVSIDGKVEFSDNERYDLSIARPVRVGACASVVDVKSFVVRPLAKKE